MSYFPLSSPARPVCWLHRPIALAFLWPREMLAHHSGDSSIGVNGSVKGTPLTPPLYRPALVSARLRCERLAQGEYVLSVTALSPAV